jgi:carbohydrate kinase (thermoresistant glucokinase family)
VSCSALRRSYRDRLRRHAPDAIFVHMAGPQQVVQARMEHRRDHFMPASLLQSQYDALEQLEPDECGVTVDLDQPVPAIVDAYIEWAAQHPAS